LYLRGIAIFGLWLIAYGLGPIRIIQKL
jgi:hypothetical protein